MTSRNTFQIAVNMSDSPGPGGSLARSRSRYKGARPTRGLTTTQEAPPLPGDQSRRLQQDGSRTQRQQQPSNQAAFVGSQDKNSAGSPSRLVNHQISQTDVISKPGVHDFRLRDQRSKANGSRHTPREIQPIPDRRDHASPLQEPQEMKNKLHPLRSEELPLANRQTTTSRRGLTQRITGQSSKRRGLKSREELKRTISGPINVEPPQSIVMPAFDAPVSAVNSGERRVNVNFGQSVMSLPVTPSTTPIDVISLANDQIPENISSENTMVVESFKQLALERPLRRYEHIRDVLNSWDSDSQNALTIMPSPTGGKDEDLELGHVSKAQPGDTCVTIYHSQKPGSWNKRSVTLRADGQILIAKKDSSENICHLSDFDIYIPTARQLSKRIKPPRKICFAVKSQQKSSMFMTTVNFVHFFSTSDRNLASLWYKAVQEWRSWYLVNVMGEGQKGSGDMGSEPRTAAYDKFESSHLRADSKSRASRGSINKRDEAQRPNHHNELPVRHRAAPPSSYQKEFAQDSRLRNPKFPEGASITQSSPIQASEPEPFIASSLLGRTYTQRQIAQKKREASQGPEPQLSTMADPNNRSVGLKRTSSQRPQTKPLVDLTPQYREAPQHVRKGRGFMPEQIPAGGLVEIATSPDGAVEIPPATTWQTPTTSNGQEEAQMHRTRTMSRDRGRAPSISTRSRQTSPKKGAAPFTGGLLGSNEDQRQGSIGIGKGVMTGNRQAKEPMLDINEPSNYAPGSLLDRIERNDGSPKPIIERNKGREMNTRVGEGL